MSQVPKLPSTSSSEDNPIDMSSLNIRSVYTEKCAAMEIASNPQSYVRHRNSLQKTWSQESKFTSSSSSEDNPIDMSSLNIRSVYTEKCAAMEIASNPQSFVRHRNSLQKTWSQVSKLTSSSSSEDNPIDMSSLNIRSVYREKCAAMEIASNPQSFVRHRNSLQKTWSQVSKLTSSSSSEDNPIDMSSLNIGSVYTEKCAAMEIASNPQSFVRHRNSLQKTWSQVSKLTSSSSSEDNPI